MLSFYTIATLCMLCDSLHPKTIVLENIYIRPRAKITLNISPTRPIKSNILIPNYYLPFLQPSEWEIDQLGCLEELLRFYRR